MHRIAQPIAVALLATAFSASAASASPFFHDGTHTAGGSWSFTGSLHTARISPVAVTLPNGDVLVTGGFNNPNSFKTSELWDTAAGKWTMTGSMHTDRVGATLTLLKTGQVLVAGGLTTIGVTNKAELYDPATGKWTVIRPMGNVRYQHTATLLADGRVLVAGGFGAQSGQSIQSVEIFDPSTGRWTRAADLNAPRESHAASLLADGDVLVTGGDSQFLTGTLGSAETYHVANNTWTVVGRMTSSRFFHAQATLADGSVMVAGGAYGRGSAYNAFPSTDRYDPVAGTWGAIGDMQVVQGAAPKQSGRTFFTATTIGNGMILAAGGIGTGTNPNQTQVFKSAELFDPSSGTWTLTADMNVTRAEHAAVELADGRAMVISGATASKATATVEIFTPGAASRTQAATIALRRNASSRLAPMRLTSARPSFTRAAIGRASGRGTWTVTGSMNFARESEPAILLKDGRVLIEGCTDPFGSGGTSAELYDPTTGTWSLTGSMNVPRCRHAAQLLPDGRVLVVGGDGGTQPHWWSSAEIYDPTTGQWTMTGMMNSPRTLGALLPLPGGLFLAPGGAALGTIPRDSADLYDPSTGVFTATPSMNVSRYVFSSTPLADGRVLVVGGTSQDNLQTTTCEIYDPVTNLWKLTGPIQEQSQAIVLLQNGQVLATNMLNTPSSALFDPATGRWTATRGSMHIVRNEATATLLDDGRVLVADGQGPNSLILASELYHPATQRWTIGASAHIGRWAQTAVRLADGRVMVVGGLDQFFRPIASAEIYAP